MYKVEMSSPPVWIPDHATTRCRGCGAAFSMLLRRHHCRLCGHIFCATCACHWIPGSRSERTVSTPESTSYLMSWFRRRQEPPSVAGDTTTLLRSGAEDRGETTAVVKRCCGSCFEQRRSYQMNERVIRSVLLVGNQFPDDDLGIRTWRVLACVCRRWRRAVDTLLDNFRALQQTRPYSRLGDTQLHMLRSSLPRLLGHTTWILLAHAQGVAISPALRLRTRRVTCASLGCTSCGSDIGILQDALLLMMGDGTATQRLLRCGDLAPLACMTNSLAAHLANGVPREAGDAFLLSLAASHTTGAAEAAHRLFFALRARDQERAAQLLGRVGPDRRDAWSQTITLIFVLERVARQQRVDHVAREAWAGARTPWDPRVRIINILTDAITTKSSSSRPTVIPCECHDERTGTTCVRCLLFKQESVLPDAMVQECVRVYRALTVTTDPVVYDVYPVTPDTGIIVMVMGCRSLYSLWSDSVSIQNYILERAPSRSVGDIRCRFSESCAFNCVLSMLVGAGDRHLDNLLIHEGRLFGVDYAYLFNREPVGKKFLSNELRITRSMIDAMGGDGSYYFQHFRISSTDMYRNFRRWHVVFYYVMRALARDDFVSDEEIRSKIDTSWLPGSACDAQADFVIEDKIGRESRGEGNFLHTINDYFHHMFRR